MNTAILLIYFILTPAHHWEFVAIEPINGIGARDYCRQQAENVALVFKDQPGNMRVVCADDAGAQI